MQEAADVVQQYAKESGLECSPQKSELLVVRRRRTKKDEDNIEINLEGHTIRPCSAIRVLGLFFQANGKCDIMLQRLATATEQVVHMIRRVTNRHRGMKEADTIRLIQAFVLSRLTYAVPYMMLTKRDTDKLNTLIRKATKQALGIPMSASTERLLHMGLHNTVDELIEGHLSSQRARLAMTKTGQKLLNRFKWNSPDIKPSKELPERWRHHIISQPLPKNMHPVHHSGRREARAKALNRKYGTLPETVFTDAAAIRGRGANTVVVTKKTELLVSATLRTSSTKEAEELAVALALTQTKATVVVTDSQEACRSFRSGWVAPVTYHMLSTKLPDKKVRIVWTPAHASMEGNEFAHQKARELADQASEDVEKPTPLVTYQEITQHYKLSRRTFPLPHPNLTKSQETTLRLLQTNTFPHPIRLHRISPTQYPAECKYCQQSGTLRHIVLECRKNRHLPPLPHTGNPQEQWETLLSSPCLSDQLLLTERAAGAKAAHGFP